MPEEGKEKQPKRKPKTIAVKVVAQRDKSALVEWEAEGDLCRAYVPADKIDGEKCDEDALAAGVPYGAPWEDLVGPVSPEAVGKHLRQRGMWTAADIEKNIQAAQRAINDATGLTPASLHTLANRYENEEA